MDIVIDKPIGTEPGEISAAMIKTQLAKANGQPIVVRLHSEGGSVFEGLAMFDAFKAYRGPKKCIIESAAFSMASAIALAFNEREITANGFVMLHNPAMDSGDAPPILEKLRQKLVAIYAAGTRKSKQSIESMMNAETFLDAREALQAGFVTLISQPTPRAVASFQAMLHRDKRFRTAIVARLGSQQAKTATARWKSEVSAQVARGINRHKAIVAVDHLHPGLRQEMIEEANKSRKGISC